MESKETNETGMDVRILNDILDAEKKAQAILEKAIEEKETIVHDAVVEASKSFSRKSEEIKKYQEKKIAEFRENATLIKQEKVNEGTKLASQIKSKSSKKMDDACDFILKKFEDLIDD